MAIIKNIISITNTGWNMEKKSLYPLLLGIQTRMANSMEVPKKTKTKNRN
jgi:hypothetical protein